MSDATDAASAELKQAGASYAHAGEEYFEKRKLKRSAGFWGVWGIGVGAVISGEFSGWNFGIGQAGFVGFGIAAAVITFMYFCMLFSIGEMAAAMPHTGGAYSFARSAMGPLGGFLTGLAETIEYVFTTAVVVYFAAQYAAGVFGDGLPQWLWWVILYAIFVGLNSWGAEASFKFALVVAVLSCAILAFFVILALAHGAVDFGSLNDIKPTGGHGEAFPFGLKGLLYALPFAMWFYLGIEELPLASEEAHNPQRDVPRAGVLGMVTLLVFAALVYVFNTAVLGSRTTGSSGQPLLDGFASFLPDSWARILAGFALIGLLASLQGIMFAYGRNLYSLSRSGYYPRILSLTGKRQTPYLALVVGAVIGFVALLIADNAGGTASSIVLNISVWGAVLAYMSQMASFVILRRKYPNAVRPYVSPTGNWGAVVAFVIAAITFVGILINSDYHSAVIAIAVLYAIGLVLYYVFARHRLVLAPEEEYAMSGGLHRDPAVEHYGSELETELPAEDFR
ncbi:amino acid permease [Streptomyces sp. NPDC101225]|uniref:amino acid permease n=1 Tax=Streptomyces sp. NPDC101225 TaxID=3366135 RepID=UPI0038156E14